MVCLWNGCRSFDRLNYLEAATSFVAPGFDFALLRSPLDRVKNTPTYHPGLSLSKPDTTKASPLQAD